MRHLVRVKRGRVGCGGRGPWGGRGSKEKRCRRQGVSCDAETQEWSGGVLRWPSTSAMEVQLRLGAEMRRHGSDSNLAATSESAEAFWAPATLGSLTMSSRGLVRCGR